MDLFRFPPRTSCFTIYIAIKILMFCSILQYQSVIRITWHCARPAVHEPFMFENIATTPSENVCVVYEASTSVRLVFRRFVSRELSRGSCSHTEHQLQNICIKDRV